MAYKAKKPTTEQRKLVETMAAVGIPGESICRVIGVSGKTLRKHCREELDLAEAKANAEVAGFLFNSAKSGNVAAQIFWLKTRAGWKEPVPVQVQHSGAVGIYDLSKIPTHELRTVIAILSAAGTAQGGTGAA